VNDADRNELELRRRRDADAKAGENATMNKLIRDEMAASLASRNGQGPPSREIVIAMRDRLRSENRHAGYPSVAKALRADGWTISESTVERRLKE
jgi:hypothetical protein